MKRIKENICYGKLRTVSIPPRRKRRWKERTTSLETMCVQFYAELLYNSIVTEQGVCCIVCRTLGCSVFFIPSKKEKSKLGRAKKRMVLLILHRRLSAKAIRMQNDAKRSQAMGKKRKLWTKMMENKPIWKWNYATLFFCCEKKFFLFRDEKCEVRKNLFGCEQKSGMRN